MPGYDPAEYLQMLKDRIAKWKQMLEVARALIEAQEEAGVPTLAVWNRYQMIAARVEALEKAVDKALKRIKGEE